MNRTSEQENVQPHDESHPAEISLELLLVRAPVVIHDVGKDRRPSALHHFLHSDASVISDLLVGLECLLGRSRAGVFLSDGNVTHSTGKPDEEPLSDRVFGQQAPVDEIFFERNGAVAQSVDRGLRPEKPYIPRDKQKRLYRKADANPPDRLGVRFISVMKLFI